MSPVVGSSFGVKFVHAEGSDIQVKARGSQYSGKKISKGLEQMAKKTVVVQNNAMILLSQNV